MNEFLLELYVPRTDVSAVDRYSDLARRGADELAHEGVRIGYIRTIYVPEDETCFVVYEADSAAEVRAAAERVSLPYDRVAEAFAASKDSP